MPRKSTNAFLTLLPDENRDAINALAAPVRLAILKLLRQSGPMNVNMISAALKLPQSTIATNIKVLEASRLIHTEAAKARKGQQKICSVPFDGVLIRLDGRAAKQRDDLVEVAMPIGLYTSCEVSAPCGLCSTEGIIGLLDVPDFFLDPSRMRASLAWFGRGFVEYKFPNNARLLEQRVEALEFSMEMSSEVPGTNVELALRHQHLGERREGRHLDLARRLRRQARHLYAALVEARGLAIRPAGHLAHLRARLVRRQGAGLEGRHRRSSSSASTTRSACASASTRARSTRAASTSSARGSATTTRTS